MINLFFSFIFIVLFIITFIELCILTFEFFKDFRSFVKEGYLFLWILSLFLTFISGYASYSFIISHF